MAEQIAGWFVNNLGGVFSPELIVFIAVSYTHLDVYKRQEGIWIDMTDGDKEKALSQIINEIEKRNIV